MNLQPTDEARQQHLRQKLRSLIGQHGIADVMRGIADLAIDWGNGDMGDAQQLPPDKYWQMLGTYLDTYAKRIDVIVKNWSK